MRCCDETLPEVDSKAGVEFGLQANNMATVKLKASKEIRIWKYPAGHTNC